VSAVDAERVIVEFLEYHDGDDFAPSSSESLFNWYLSERMDGWMFYPSWHERTDQLGHFRVWKPGSGESFPNLIACWCDRKGFRRR
jgi:hypothetical protein